MLRPGKLTQEWIAGRRNSFLHPGKLYVVCSALLFGVLALPGTSMAGRDAVAGFIEGWDGGQGAVRGEQISPGLTERPEDQAQAAERIATAITEHMPTVMFLLLPFAASLLYLLVQPRLPYLIHMVWALHVHSLVFLAGIALALLDLLSDTAPYVAVPLTAAGALWVAWYVLAAFARVYDRTILTSVGLLGIAGLAYLPVVGGALFVISLVA
jgi:hypothetical protein